MLDEYKTTLSEVFRDVLMRYVFMFGEECEKESIMPDNFDYLHVHVAFNGYYEGRFGIIAPAQLCIEMSANVIGTDIEDDNCVDDAKDTFEELANIICGQFLTSAYGDEPIFNLSPPSISEADELSWVEIFENDDSLAFMIEDTPALIYLEIERDEIG
jgi:chemotaxis protein CheY-P-specific phosphatase CheC